MALSRQRRALVEALPLSSARILLIVLIGSNLCRQFGAMGAAHSEMLCNLQLPLEADQRLSTTRLQALHLQNSFLPSGYIKLSEDLCHKIANCLVANVQISPNLLVALCSTYPIENFLLPRRQPKA